MVELRLSLADDDPGVADHVTRLLASAGYRCAVGQVPAGEPTGRAADLDRVDSQSAQAAAQGLQAELRRTLEETNRELESVLYVTSHDLRSPLVNILGFAKELSRACETLRATFRPESPGGLSDRPVRLILERDIPESLHYIQASALKMDALLTGLLRLSRLGRQPLVPLELDMNSLLAQVLDSLNFQIRNSGARIEVDNLPRCRGDATQVHQLFTNLLDNALKYLQPARPGHIQVRGRVSAEGVLYCVQDNGMGIAPDQQERVFELFHRLEPQRCAGEGLGLTIAHRIAVRHGGKIWVESVPEDGCSFFVSLPL